MCAISGDPMTPGEAVGGRAVLGGGVSAAPLCFQHTRTRHPSCTASSISPSLPPSPPLPPPLHLPILPFVLQPSLHLFPLHLPIRPSTPVSPSLHLPILPSTLLSTLSPSILPPLPPFLPLHLPILSSAPSITPMPPPSLFFSLPLDLSLSPLSSDPLSHCLLPPIPTFPSPGSGCDMSWGGLSSCETILAGLSPHDM